MLAISLTPELERQLVARSQAAGQELTAFVQSIIRDYMEDQADAQRAEEVLAQNNRRYTLEHVERELGLAD